MKENLNYKLKKVTSTLRTDGIMERGDDIPRGF